jgi:hypothetical protein
MAIKKRGRKELASPGAPGGTPDRGLPTAGGDVAATAPTGARAVSSPESDRGASAASTDGSTDLKEAPAVSTSPS